MNKKLILSLLAIFLFSNMANAQKLISEIPLISLSSEDIDGALGMPISIYGVNLYSVTYTSEDGKGNPDTLSGLILLPDTSDIDFPYLIVEHGQSKYKEHVPSSPLDIGIVLDGIVLASQGNITLMPDYMGLGNGRGFNPTYVASAFFKATEDMYLSAKAKNYTNSEQLFVFGYSQGAYGSLSFQKGMQEKYGASSISGAIHVSGAYLISNFRDSLISGNITDDNSNVFATTITILMGFNEVYDIPGGLAGIFKPEYLSFIQEYHDNIIDWDSMAEGVYLTMLDKIGHINLSEVINNGVLTELKNNPNYILNQAFYENDSYKWVPESPTLFLYCTGDDAVPSYNTTRAIDTMLALGASPIVVQAFNVDQSGTLGHSECYLTSFGYSIPYLQSLQKEEDDDSTDVGLNKNTLTDTYKVYPNPAKDKLIVETNNQIISEIIITDLNGREMYLFKNDLTNRNELDITDLSPSIYILCIRSINGNSFYEKLIINN